MSKYIGFESLVLFEGEGDSKSKILNSAIYHFAMQGYKETTTKAIAEFAGLSEALLFKQFKNKQNLLKEVSLEIVENRIPYMIRYNLDDVFTIKNDPTQSFTIEDFKQLIKSKIILISQNAGYAKIIILELQHNSEQTIQQITKLLETLFFNLTQVVDILKQKNILRSDIDSKILFRSLAGMMNLLIIDKSLITRDLDLEYELDVILEIFLKGAGYHEPS